MKRILILFSCICFITACANNNAADEKQTNKVQNVKQSVESPKEKRMSSNEIAKHLTNLARQVPDVNDATAVVAGKYAIVGIDVNKKLDRSRVGTIKYSVAEALKNDPYGATAIVTADADTVQRLREMGKEIRQGRPVGGIVEELAAIIGRIMPEVPNEIMDTKPEPTESNNKQLNKKEEREMKQQQEKQDLQR
ncbi:YhcN/YlaJ family sporulation lipoprotein [Pseudalkalibacillus caeni]|uniref:YhcN/YlaJ family sporulation lipoprotein n=1 Tax=Exobacillus caeni TaxID=2574798 RepID=A0A5R9FDE7_9BACL|nr:YhcN/YlaJ family sporulation lipoprotein [Pseudalkalibacillus caeni]TLS37675.1 YhcN/YlaJ family sporulation lipoprotein [Pseudalkalibacillus caeni]